MTADRMMRGDAGVSGRLVLDDRHLAISQWQITEGDYDQPGGCRGWFKSLESSFLLFPGMRVALTLESHAGTEQALSARIAHHLSDGIWEFVCIASEYW